MNRALSILVVLLFLVSAFPSPGFLGDSRPIEVSIGDGEGSVIEDASVTENLKALRAEIAHLEAEGFGEALDRVIDRTLALERQVLVFFYADWCHFSC